MLAEVVDAYVVDPVGSLVSSSFIHLPTALCSTSITRFHSSYGSSDSCSGLLPLQVSPLTRTPLCSRSVVNHPIAIPLFAPVLLWDIGFTFPSQARLAIKPNHVHFRYACAHHLLRTSNSPPVAPHLSSRTRSYSRFRRLGRLRIGLPPIRVVRLAGAQRRPTRSPSPTHATVAISPCDLTPTDPNSSASTRRIRRIRIHSPLVNPPTNPSP